MFLLSPGLQIQDPHMSRDETVFPSIGDTTFLTLKALKHHIDGK